MTFALFADRLTTVSDDAAEARLTVQVELPGALKVFGAQLKPLRPESPVGETRLICVDCVSPFRLPVTVTVSLVVIVPVETLNNPVVCPFGIVTFGGVVNCDELSESVTSMEPTAAAFNVAVQFVFWLLFRDPATQLMPDNTGAVSVRPALRETPFKVAVITGKSFAGIAVTLTEN